MTKSYTKLQAEIARLQKEAEALRAKEIGEVVGRIREAISAYGLTAADLFGKAAVKTASGRNPRAAKGAKGKKGPAKVKYRDEAGNTWVGRGKRPVWFTQALAAGKKPEDLLVK